GVGVLICEETGAMKMLGALGSTRNWIALLLPGALPIALAWLATATYSALTFGSVTGPAVHFPSATVPVTSSFLPPPVSSTLTGPASEAVPVNVGETLFDGVARGSIVTAGGVVSTVKTILLLCPSPLPMLLGWLAIAVYS